MHVNRTNTRADRFKVTDVELRGDGTPVMSNGRCIKTVEYTTTTCPECEGESDDSVPARIDDIGDAICPSCGIVCSGPNNICAEDSTFTARGGFESSGFPALNDPSPRTSGSDNPASSTASSGSY